jgi:Tfp pilus tip-associated adhesin PilY1
LHNDTGQGLPQDLFRERLSRLGDVINAQPAYVKKSPFSYSDTGYAGFKKCTEGTGSGCVAAQFPTPSVSRRGTVYAAANDGMLHAFETDVNNSPYYQTLVSRPRPPRTTPSPETIPVTAPSAGRTSRAR